VMGTGVIGGMFAATGIAIFLIPMMYYVIGSLGERKRPGAEGPGQADGGSPQHAPPLKGGA
jgi:hypothetical protein